MLARALPLRLNQHVHGMLDAAGPEPGRGTHLRARDVVEAPPHGTALHVVRAENSDRWPSGEWQRLETLAREEVRTALSHRSALDACRVRRPGKQVVWSAHGFLQSFCMVVYILNQEAKVDSRHCMKLETVQCFGT
jgi:hypothetical protein